MALLLVPTPSGPLGVAHLYYHLVLGALMLYK